MDFFDWIIGVGGLDWDDNGLSFAEYLDAMLAAQNTDSGCTVNSSGYHFWRCSDLVVGGITGYFEANCAYCFMSYAEYLDLDSDGLTGDVIEDLYSGYVDSLDYSTITDEGLFNYYPTGWSLNSPYLNSSDITSSNGGFELDGLCLANQSGVAISVYSDYFSLPKGAFTFWVDEVYGKASTTSGRYSICLYGTNSKTSSGTFIVEVVDHSYNFPKSKAFSGGNYLYYYCRTSIQLSSTVKVGDRVLVGRSCHITCDELSDNVVIEEAPRVADLMSIVAEYNAKNPYNEAANKVLANFFLGKTDAEGNVTDTYSPDIFNEQTLVFTEPITGTQYQTTGWTYNYKERMYHLDLTPGTITIDDTDIATVALIYGEDSLIITYLDANGNLIQDDWFSYVVASQSSCTLYGHTNQVETTDPTCTGTGKRTTTCTVCGATSSEILPPAGHNYVSTVMQAPTCTSNGMQLLTCIGCEDQYTDTIEALGHSWQLDSVEDNYILPDNAQCPDCFSTDFNYVLELDTGQYTCMCNSCDIIFSLEAVPNNEFAVNVCPDCGQTKVEYTGDGGGLFHEIGDFLGGGLSWCADKLALAAEALQQILDTLVWYVDIVVQSTSEFPLFLGSVLAAFPPELTAVIWMSVILFVAVAVIKNWLR